MPAAGLLMLVLAATGLYARRHQYLLQHCPYPIVINLAKLGYSPAVEVLRIRYNRKILTPEQAEEVIEAALHQQETAARSFALHQWLYFLEDLKLREELTPEQVDRYYSQGLHSAEFFARRRYRVGEALVVGLSVDFRGMDYGWVQGERAASGLLEKISASEQHLLSRGRGSFNKLDFLTVVFPHKFVRVGQDNVLIRANLAVWGTTFELEGGKGSRIKAETIAPVEVVPADFIEPVDLTTSDSLGQQLTSGLSVLLEYPIEYRDKDEIQMVQCHVISAQPLPTSIAADVILEQDETVQHVGTLFGWKGTRIVRSDISQLEQARFGGEDLSLVLVFNPQLMQETAGLEEVFAGTLRLKPAKVDTLQPPAPRSLSSGPN